MNEPKRLYLDAEVVHPAGRRKVSIYRTSDTNIEYTRTGAFIEKACSWLENNLQGIVGGSIYIEDFRKYMEGE